MPNLLRDCNAIGRESFFVDRRPIVIPDVTTYNVSPNNSGKVHFFQDLTANCTVNLPAAEDGLEFEFQYAGVAADAQNWIIRSAAAANFFRGGVVHADLDAGSGADELIPVFPNGTTNAKLTVVTPQGGNSVRFTCALWTPTGVLNWIVTGIVASNTVPAFADLP